MLNKIFDTDELPNFKVYEMAQIVVNDYMEKKRCKIHVVAAELETTTGTLYRLLNPKDTLMPLSIDRIIAITTLTKDNRILEAIAREFDMVLVPKKQVCATVQEINILVDDASIENSDVFRVVKTSISNDGKIDAKERDQILKEIDEAQIANAKLKDMVLHINNDE
jgi:hypothetical protein